MAEVLTIATIFVLVCLMIYKDHRDNRRCETYIPADKLGQGFRVYGKRAAPS